MQIETLEDISGRAKAKKHFFAAKNNCKSYAVDFLGFYLQY